jgi:hypothetical protein
MGISGAKEKIHAALQDWPGITSQPHCAQVALWVQASNGGTTGKGNASQP